MYYKKTPLLIALLALVFAGCKQSSSDFDSLTDSEKKYLAFAPRFITFEQVLRFLMDYIDGDTYYRIKYPGHNLVRTHSQYRLLQSMEQQYARMQDIVGALI